LRVTETSIKSEAMRLVARVDELRAALNRQVLGQEALVDDLLVAILAGGHVLLEGLPGLGKTLLVRALGRGLGLQYARIQFTPDLMPADITGTTVVDESGGKRSFRFQPGPIFAGLVLADEINRATPKTQSAMLEAMQEGSVTIAGESHRLPEPFHVVATQNPIELEGTYPLPEAQLDRFMFNIIIEHPPENEEFEVVRTTTAILDPQFKRPVTGPELVAFQRLVRRVPVAEPVMRYALSIVRTSRPKSPQAPELVKKYVSFGASVRAAQFLILGAKAKALTDGRYHVSFDDVRALAHPVLRHRVLANFRAESEGITTDAIVDELLKVVPTPKSGM
jgi:MoxR-like ATPase